MELDLVRKELNKYDAIIRNMINLRMSLIPIVADIKKRNNIPLVQKNRENEIYANIENFAKENGVNAELVKNIYKGIIANALDIEEEYEKMPEKENGIDAEKVNKEFKRLDDILEKEIPEILSNISLECSKSNLNLNQIATLYYNEKVNK